MVFERKDMPTAIKEQLRGGSGNTQLLHVVPPDALPVKSRMFAVATLAPGCSIGDHDHVDETEIYYVLSGEGVVHDNGRELSFKVGDTNVCGGGSTHGIVNTGSEPLVFVAAIILD